MPASVYDWMKRWIAIIALLGLLAPLDSLAEIIDYHQHLYSPQAGERSTPGPKGINADYLVAQLDAAGISRAVILSVAYSFSNPHKAPVSDEYAHVMAENNWTSAQVAKYPHRLLGFCSVNPLRSYALKEIVRCAKDPNLRTGLKLHFGNSDVDVDNPDHLARVQRVFRAANGHHMAIVVHMHANIDHHRPYGAKGYAETMAPCAVDPGRVQANRQQHRAVHPQLGLGSGLTAMSSLGNSECQSRSAPLRITAAGDGLDRMMFDRHLQPIFEVPNESIFTKAQCKR